MKFVVITEVLANIILFRGFELQFAATNVFLATNIKNDL